MTKTPSSFYILIKYLNKFKAFYLLNLIFTCFCLCRRSSFRHNHFGEPHNRSGHHWATNKLVNGVLPALVPANNHRRSSSTCCSQRNFFNNFFSLFQVLNFLVDNLHFSNEIHEWYKSGPPKLFWSRPILISLKFSTRPYTQLIW